MCGIVGFFGDGDLKLLTKLTGLLAHRGPDGEGFYSDELLEIYLGHRRLTIRDRVGGSQPMRTDDDRYLLSYNGEIYNDEELRSQLESLGHKFVSQSDTEVVLRSMIEWGESAPEKLDGQFAFCFIDRTKKKAMLVRDRFGEKPLFWARSSRGIVFASESSVVGTHSGIFPELDEENCIRFLIMGYLPPPYSILKGIRQLHPGHILTISIADDFDTRDETFALPWHPFSGTATDSANSLSLQSMERAVNSRRISDVPVGVLLSGGIDSSLVAIGAARIGWIADTYTIGFRDKSFDESEFAEELARKLNLPNYQMELDEISGEEVVQLLGMLDEPLGDASFIPTYLIFKFASKRAKVLLTGDGGDEIFFGYEPFRVLRFSHTLQQVLPHSVRRLLTGLISLIPRTDSYMNRFEVAERFLDGLNYSPVKRVLVWMATLRVSEWSRFFAGDVSPKQVYEFSDVFSDVEDSGEAVRRLFLSTYLPGSVLTKSDRASMANSVEARTIFFYPEVVNYGLKKNVSDEIRGRRGKQSLRQIVMQSGLEDVAVRKKHGFALPVSEVLRSLKIPPPQIELSGVNQKEIDLEWAKLRDGKPTRVHFLWAVLSLANSRAYRLVATV